MKIKKHVLNTKNIDNYCYVIESKKTSKGLLIYSGYNIISVNKTVIKKEQLYVAQKDKFYAHGDTVKKAVEDLNFKIVSEKLKNEPIKKDTIITVNYYRLITGSCMAGVNSWIKQNNIKKYEYTASELLPLLKKTNAYGLEKFISLCTFI